MSQTPVDDTSAPNHPLRFHLPHAHLDPVFGGDWFALKADLMALLDQFPRKPRRALARPAQRRLRVAAGGRLNQGIKVAHKRRILVGQFLTPAPGGTDAPLAGDTDSRWPSRGNRASTRARFFSRSAFARGSIAPVSRFSATVSVGNTCRPSGTWATPSLAIL